MGYIIIAIIVGVLVLAFYLGKYIGENSKKVKFESDGERWVLTLKGFPPNDVAEINRAFNYALKAHGAMRPEE